MSQICSHKKETDESLRQAEEAILAERMSRIRQKIVVMSGKGGVGIDVFKTGGGEALASEMNVPYLGRVPMDPAVVSNGDNGYRLPDTTETASSPFRSIVETILDRTPAGRVELNVIQP